MYLALADRIAEDVASGRLTPGIRLPTQRGLAQSLGVDLTTVTRGYAEARRRGLLSGKVGRGTFVVPVLRAGGRALGESESLTDLSLNLPPRLEPDVPGIALAQTLAELPKTGEIGSLLEYQNNAGMDAHRAAGASWIGQRGAEPDANRVVVTSGAQHAISVLLSTLLTPGDVVLTEELTYPGFRAAAEYLGLGIHGLPLDDEGIVVDAFRKACRARAKVLYIQPTLHNPTTITTSPERRAALVKVARTHGVKIIEDDVYAALAESAPPPLVTYAPELVYYVASLTKALAGGLRIGYVLSPTPQDAERIAAGVRVTTWMAAPLMAHIASDWVRSYVARDILKANRDEARRRQATAAGVFRGWTWRADRSGYHGWLELPEPWSSAEFVTRARKSGVAVTPADAFAVGDGVSVQAVRLSVTAARDTSTLKLALDRLVRLLELGPRMSTQVM